VKRKTWAAILLFFAFVLVFTFNDKLVHNDLYIDVQGLQFREDWLLEYWFNYFLMYEIAILATTAICLNKWFFVFTEVFVVFTTQDIMFFVWAGYFPTEEWTWMWQYHLFGTWTTVIQLAISSLIFVGLGVFALFYHSSFRTTKVLEVKN